MQRRRTLVNGRGCGGGFTLLELALALAVLAVILGLAWPSLMRFVAEQGLKQETRLVGGRLGSLRLRAIDQGLVYQFRYEAGGRRYILLPAERPQTPAAEGGATHMTAAVAPPPQQVQSFELAEEYRFTANTTGRRDFTAAPATEKLPQEWLALFGGDARLAEVNWSRPLRFKPDGAAEAAPFAIEDSGGRYQTLSLRGFTGALSIGPIERQETPR